MIAGFRRDSRRKCRPMLSALGQGRSSGFQDGEHGRSPAEEEHSAAVCGNMLVMTGAGASVLHRGRGANRERRCFGRSGLPRAKTRVTSFAALVQAAFRQYQHLVQVPFVARPWPAALERVGECSPEAQAPGANALVAHDDPALCQDRLNLAQAQAEAVVEPHLPHQPGPGQPDNATGRSCPTISAAKEDGPPLQSRMRLSERWSCRQGTLCIQRHRAPRAPCR